MATLLPFSVSIFPLPRYVNIGMKKRKRYYKRSSRLPEKVIKKLQSGEYIFSPTGQVLHRITKLKVEIPTRKTAHRGTPINGQLIYSGYIKEFDRAKYVKAIKAAFRPFLLNVSPIQGTCFPIKIYGKLHVFIEDGVEWDVDNLWIYGKVIQDLLVDLKIIPKDTVKYVTHPLDLQVIMWKKDEPYAPESEGLVITFEQDTNNLSLK